MTWRSATEFASAGMSFQALGWFVQLVKPMCPSCPALVPNRLYRKPRGSSCPLVPCIRLSRRSQNLPCCSSSQSPVNSHVALCLTPSGEPSALLLASHRREC